MKSPNNRLNNLRGVVPVSENRPPQVQTVHTPLQRDCAVEGERGEEAPFHSLPAAAAIFKMPSIS